MHCLSEIYLVSPNFVGGCALEILLVHYQVGGADNSIEHVHVNSYFRSSLTHNVMSNIKMTSTDVVIFTYYSGEKKKGVNV